MDKDGYLFSMNQSALEFNAENNFFHVTSEKYLKVRDERYQNELMAVMNSLISQTEKGYLGVPLV